MLSFSSRNIFSLLCAGAVLSLVGCGGSSSDGGLAPDSLSGYLLQVNPENSDDPANSPGPMNIAGGAGTGTVGYVNAGTAYTAGVQTIFNKTSPNQAHLLCNALNPDNPENPTSQFIKFEAYIDFNTKTGSTGITVGEITSWTYVSSTTGNVDDDGNLKVTTMTGTSGVAKLIPLQ